MLEDFLNSRIPTKLLHKQLHFIGFFQNLRYFDHFRDELMRDFTLNSPFSKRNQALKQRILATPDSCFISAEATISSLLPSSSLVARIMKMPCLSLSAHSLPALLHF